jgi:hypothetical protein
VKIPPWRAGPAALRGCAAVVLAVAVATGRSGRHHPLSTRRRTTLLTAAALESKTEHVVVRVDRARTGEFATMHPTRFRARTRSA